MYKKILLILLCGLALSFSVPAEALWLSGYEYRKEITIDHTKIGSALANFPLAVMLSDTTNIIDGNDVKFTLSDGETKLDYEMESYATDDAVYWVNIPTVSSGTNTTFYMYYGKEGDTDESTTAVWDSNYKMVQHMEESGTGTRYDSTANNNDGSPQNYDGDEAVIGKLDGANNFDGVNDYVEITDMNLTNSVTVETWVKFATITPSIFLIKFSTPPPDGCGDYWLSSTGESWQVASYGGHGVVAGGTIIENQWDYVTLIFSSNNYLKLYVNGDYIGEDTSPGPLQGLNYPFWMGRWSSLYAGVTLDEVRISNSIRSADWLKASYHSGSNNLLTFGNEEGGAIPEPTSLLLLGFSLTGIAVFRKNIYNPGK